MMMSSPLRGILTVLLAGALAFLPLHGEAQNEEKASAPAESPAAVEPEPEATPEEAEQDAGQEEAPKTMNYYAYLLRAPRLTFAEDATAEEQAKVGEHFEYLKKLFGEGTVLVAGRSEDLAFPGLVIYRAESDEAAKAIMEADPAIAAGIFRAEMTRYRFPLNRIADSERMSNTPQNETDRVLEKVVVVNAPIAEVWDAWTTTEGVKRFFVSEANVELRVGGAYEMYFVADAPMGSKGSEGCRVLSFIPEEMLSFEWNAPPSFGELRGQKTRVVLQFEEVAPGWTKVELSHLGWGEGENWDGVYDYFDRAWGSVLGSLKQNLENPPKPAEPKPAAESSGEESES